MTHRVEIRVRFGELDPYSHVNHAVYLQYFEHGRVVALEDAGQGLDLLMAGDVAMVVVQVGTRFLAPAYLGDRLVVESGISQAGRATATWHQRILRGDDVLVTQVVRVGCTTAAGRARRFPAAVIEALAPLTVPADWLGNQAPR